MNDSIGRDRTGIRDWGAAGAAVMLLTLGTACTPPERDLPPNPDLTAEVGMLLQEYVAAIDARDPEGIRNAYVDDGRFVWLEDGSVRYRSAEEILASLEGFPPDSPIRTELTNLTVAPIGETGAHAWANFSTTVGTGPGGFSFGGVISFVAERIDGSWRLISGHSSSGSGR